MLVTPMPVQAQNTVTINIPSQPLSDALLQLGQQTSLQILYTPDLVRKLNTSGLRGNYTPENALRQLLKGTGIEYERQGNIVTLKRISAVTLPSLTVSTASLKQGTAEEGYRVSNISGIGLWGERSLRDTPYSISVVPSDLIENVNAQNMGQIFKMNPLTQEPTILNHNGESPRVLRRLQLLREWSHE
ncbi:secretin and TonB N-terminal domain-containing protein [Nitrosomonas europaea]|uniref:STN domain-containing protein n=1 Tax=Nitrosomonas europaea TaxID=915 RepID=UPI0032643241